MEQLQAKLDQLIALDTDFKIFGASSHRYAKDDVVSEEELRELEQDSDFTLPADYRQYLLEVAGGGAGPYYGLVNFENEGMESDSCTFSFSDLADDFPYPDGFQVPPPPSSDDYAALDEYYETYFGPLTGAVPLSDYGCAISIWLVINGPATGTVWKNDRANDGTVTKIANSFTEWYEAWLDESLAALRT